MVAPGRQTQGCRPRLLVLNLGLRPPTEDWLLLDEGRYPLVGLRSGTLINCRLACSEPDPWRWEKVGTCMGAP